MSVGFSLNIFLAKYAVSAYIVVVTKRNDISCNLRPPDVTYSRTIPYAVNVEIMPK